MNSKYKILQILDIDPTMGSSNLAWPDRFFPFLYVVAEPQKNGKKRSGHARLGQFIVK